MGTKKYKYYFKKPRSMIVKDIFYWLMVTGAVCFAASSPYFIRNVLRSFEKGRRYPKKRLADTFYNLRRQGLIDITKKNRQIYITLTETGKKKAGWMQIDSLKIKKPKKWDRKWRIVMFDIEQLKKLYREAFRGKLKKLGFCSLQKSVWIYPYDCQAEVELLRDFFALTEKEIRLIISENIGCDDKMKKFFKL